VDEKEYKRKYVNLRVLKSVQDYLKADTTTPNAVYPISVPEDLLYQALKLQGAENTDKLVHHIFKLGLTFWSEKLFHDEFSSEQSLENFIKLVKKRNREGK
jgi:hypothetical protein